MINSVRRDGPIFLMLMGLPGAGKSTLRESAPSDFLHLSTDDLIEEEARRRGLTYSEAFSDAIKPATASVNESFRQAIKNGISIIWDQTNLTAKKRRGVLAQLPSTYYKIIIEVRCDENERQQRILARSGKVIPPYVDETMVKTMAVPTAEEGWDEILVQHT